MYRRLSTRSLAATTAAALISCIVVTGCQHSSAAATSASSAGITTASTPPATTAASTAAAAPTATSTCEVWPGVGDLDASAFPLREAAAFPLREAAGDIGINGYEDSSDSLSVNVAVTGLAKLLSQLPDSYADEIQNDVITPAESGNASELDTAAANAQSIATTISQLCYTP